MRRPWRQVSTWAAGLVCLVAAGGAIPLQTPKSIPGWGEAVDPAGDCTIRLDVQTLVFSLPDSPHDFRADTRLRNAPRTQRDIEGNFAATLKVSGKFEPTPEGAEPSQAAGFYLWQDDRNYVRFLIAGSAVVLEYWKDAQPKIIRAVAPSEGNACWIRLTRRASNLKAELSADGENWTEAASLPIRLSSRLRLGTMAVNPGGKALEVRLDNWQVKSVPLYPTEP